MINIETELLNISNKGIDVLIAIENGKFDIVASKNGESCSYKGNNLYLGLSSTTGNL